LIICKQGRSVFSTVSQTLVLSGNLNDSVAAFNANACQLTHFLMLLNRYGILYSLLMSVDPTLPLWLFSTVTVLDRNLETKYNVMRIFILAFPPQ
jgi:hypothetical protein